MVTNNLKQNIMILTTLLIMANIVALYGLYKSVKELLNNIKNG